MASADAGSTMASLPAATDSRFPATLTPESSTDSGSDLTRRGSLRRKLSKQKGVEETETAPLPLPVVQESLADVNKPLGKEDSPSGMNSRSRDRQLVRGLALCGDDDTRLRPPPAVLQRHSNSLSRESSGTDYTDSSGIDLRSFIVATLHKNPRDRQMALWLEQQLTAFINDDSAQSFKFPPSSSYQRMLIHRVAAIFGLDHNVDNSGKSIVVNKTDRTARPEFDFSSLILGAQYTDFQRRNQRSAQSFDEVIDPSLMGFGYGGRSVDSWWAGNRRTHSFEGSHLQNGSQHYYQPNSFGTTGYQPNPVERTVNLRKAGSFGGVPAYYRSKSAQENGDRPGNTPRDYSTHSSMGSPANIAELTDGIAAVQIDGTPRIQMSPMTTVNPTREYMYSYGYQQPMYVNSPALSPSGYPIPSPYIVQTTVHQVAVQAPAGPVSYVAHPQYYASQNGYLEDPSLYQAPTAAYAYSQMPYMVPQPYYENTEYLPESCIPQNGELEHRVEGQTHITVPHSLQSLDRGYGSLTNQDSLREDTECP